MSTAKRKGTFNRRKSYGIVGGTRKFMTGKQTRRDTHKLHGKGTSFMRGGKGTGATPKNTRGSKRRYS